MSTRNLTDDLLTIACASLPEEMPERLATLLRDKALPREQVAEEARRVIGLLRLQAKSMDRVVPGSLDEAEATRLGLREWSESTRARAAELRREADEFERTTVEIGLVVRDETPKTSARGLLRGLNVSDEEIAGAKRSLAGDSNGPS
jgi:hypothetical protein